MERRAQRRRRVLRTTAAAGVASIAGCVGELPAGGEADATGTRRDVLRFETLDVAGSPGGTVALRPPDRLSLVDFFATWCAPCRPQMDTLARLREQYDAEQLQMVSLTTESDEQAVRRFWKRYDGAWPVAMDPSSESVQKYSVKGIPTLVLVAPDGTEYWRHRGLAGLDTVNEQVQAALDG